MDMPQATLRKKKAKKGHRCTSYAMPGTWHLPLKEQTDATRRRPQQANAHRCSNLE